MSTGLVESRGIFHGLPVISEDIEDLTAVVTGANGISGFHTMRALLESPDRWKKVYAISRRPPPPEMMALIPKDHQKRVEHIVCDFLETPEEIGNVISRHRLNHIDYVFFYSYLQPPLDPNAGPRANAEALVEVNSTLLKNFLEALQLTALVPERFVLQTGAKHYGVHLGTVLLPSVESDPRVNLEPNFYYPQEDILLNFCGQTGCSLNVIRPAWIIGATSNAQMNIFHAVAVYAAVQAHRGRPLLFPGNLDSWNAVQGHSSAMLTGYLTEWVALEEHTAGEAFNSTDGGNFTWSRFWPELARWYGVAPEDAPPPTTDNGSEAYSSLESLGDPPIGYGPNAIYRYSFKLSEWAQDPKNQDAWKNMMERHSLIHDPFKDIEGLFRFADTALCGRKIHVSMNKARMSGWTGFVDTNQAIFLALQEMGRIGMLPPMRKGARAVGYV